MFAARDGNAAAGFELGVSLNVIGDYGLLQPTKMKRLQQGEHAFCIIQCPTHIGVRHRIDFLANSLPHRADEIEISLQTSSTIGWSPSKAQLYREEAFFFVALGLGCQLSQVGRVKPRSINGDLFFCSPAKQAEDRLSGRFTKQVPECYVDSADGHHANAFASKGHGLAIHLLPQALDVPGLPAD